MHEIDSTIRRLLRDPRKRRAWVIYQVSIKGSSLAEIARRAGVKKQTLYRAFDIPYPRMEKVIADAVDLTPQELFSERYDADGLPARKMGRPRKVCCQGCKDTAPATPRNVQRKAGVRRVRRMQ